MNEFGHLKTYTMKLTTLSPIFIGSGDKLSNLDFFYNFSTGELKLLDKNKFSNFLITNNLLDDFMSYTLNNKFVKLFEWAKTQNLDLNKYDIFKKTYKYSKNDVKALNDVNLFIKNSSDKAYIPGSSIKGVIRTAILQKRLNNYPEVKNKYRQEITNALKFKNQKDLAKIEKNIEKDLICLKHQDKLKQEVADIFRGIQITDTNVFKNDDLDLYKKFDYSLGDDKIHGLPIFRECIKPYISANFNITLDTNIVKVLDIDIDYILSALDEFSNFWHSIISCFKKDIDRFNLFLPNDDENYKPNFCIGGGAGFFTKTIIYSILDIECATNSVKHYLDLAFKSKGKPAHKHVQRDYEISPRTLKLALDDKEYINLGWCNISREN